MQQARGDGRLVRASKVATVMPVTARGIGNWLALRLLTATLLLTHLLGGVVAEMVRLAPLHRALRGTRVLARAGAPSEQSLHHYRAAARSSIWHIVCSRVTS